MSLSFIEIDSTKRVFRFYCIQGRSRLYHYDELTNGSIALDELKSKIIVKGRIPRTQDFIATQRHGWNLSLKPVIKRAQHRILKLMTNLAPLLPIKFSIAQLSDYCTMDVAPIVLDQFLDGRTGMSCK